ncbi:hypothetical protein ACOMHN_012487 [Nucella lapillus]
MGHINTQGLLPSVTWGTSMPSVHYRSVPSVHYYHLAHWAHQCPVSTTICHMGHINAQCPLHINAQCPLQINAQCPLPSVTWGTSMPSVHNHLSHWAHQCPVSTTSCHIGHINAQCPLPSITLGTSMPSVHYHLSHWAYQCPVSTTICKRRLSVIIISPLTIVHSQIFVREAKPAMT